MIKNLMEKTPLSQHFKICFSLKNTGERQILKRKKKKKPDDPFFEAVSP